MPRFDAVSDAEGVVDASLDIPCDAPCEPGKQCVDGVCVPVPPSCMAGAAGAGLNCGAASKDDCCASDEVRAGSFFRDYDGVDALDMSYPASVSQLRLDWYEVTVGRFRQFVNATLVGDASPGWTPDGGSGKHTHLNGTNGLSSGGDAAVTFETGWDPPGTRTFPTTRPTGTLSSHSAAPRRASRGSRRGRLPIHGRLRAARTRISRSRVSTGTRRTRSASGTAGSCRAPTSGTTRRPAVRCNTSMHGGSRIPARTSTLPTTGASIRRSRSATTARVSATCSLSAPCRREWACGDRWILTGNVSEWILDSDPAPFALPCVDCATTASGSTRGTRGGSCFSSLSQLSVPDELFTLPAEQSGDTGLRCARLP